MLGCLCYGGGDWLMMYGDPTCNGTLKWLTTGTAAIAEWRYRQKEIINRYPKKRTSMKQIARSFMRWI